jgi:hypothetical protein
MNPREVCALHRKNHYDLILLDLQMPGMDGFQVMEGLKTNEVTLPAGDRDYRPARPQAARAAGRCQGLHQQAVRPGGSQDAHPQHAGSAPAVQTTRTYNQVLEQTVQERTAELRESEARYRSLTELASTGTGSRTKTEFHQGFRPVLEMLGIRVDPGGTGPATVPTEQAGTKPSARSCRPPSPPASRSWIFCSPRQHRWLAQQFRVSGEPMFNQSCRFIGYRGIGVEVTGRPLMEAISARPAAPSPAHSPNQNRLLAALPNPTNGHVWPSTSSPSRCSSVRCSTSRVRS